MTRLSHPDLVSRIMAAVDRILHVEKGRVLEVDGVKLHPSEIHVVLFLGDRPLANATDIAERFSVTKGAVSQTLSRLEGKGILERGRNPEAPTELSVSFTPLGEKVMAQARRVREKAERRFDRLLSALSKTERKAVGRFFRLMLKGA